MATKPPEDGWTENKCVILDNEEGSTDHKVLHDYDVLGRTNVTREDAIHLGQLTEEELMHEKKLLRKIDAMIMPLVMLVSHTTDCYVDIKMGLTVLSILGVSDELY
jgi:hypothetical protein